MAFPVHVLLAPRRVLRSKTQHNSEHPLRSEHRYLLFAAGLFLRFFRLTNVLRHVQAATRCGGTGFHRETALPGL